MEETPQMFTAVIEQMSGSPRMESERWDEVIDLDQARRIAARLGFGLVEEDGIGGWLVEVLAEDQRAAILAGSLEQVGGIDFEVPFRVRFAAP